MYGRSHLRLHSWAVVVCLIRLICLSKFISLLKCKPRYFAELVSNIIILLMLMSGNDAVELDILILINLVFFYFEKEIIVCQPVVYLI